MAIKLLPKLLFNKGRSFVFINATPSRPIHIGFIVLPNESNQIWQTNRNENKKEKKKGKIRKSIENEICNNFIMAKGDVSFRFFQFTRNPEMPSSLLTVLSLSRIQNTKKLLPVIDRTATEQSRTIPLLLAHC